MSARYVFNLRGTSSRSTLPSKILLVQRETETLTHILLKLFGFLLFQRERLQIEPHLDDEYIPYTPDLLQTDLQGRIALWVECGECAVTKLDRLAVKVPDAEIWTLKPSAAAAADLLARMRHDELRPGRYGLVGLDPAMLAEVAGLTQARNDVVWHRAAFEPAEMQFEYNGLWFDAPFSVLRW